MKMGCNCRFDINQDCEKTWKLIGTGNTVGCFQIDSYLGQTWCKKVKPKSISDLSDILAIIRPGVLNAIVDDSGMTMADKYLAVKNGEMEPEYFHEKLIPVLQNTYGNILFQEQTLEIAKIIGGFDLAQADKLRKGIGHKLANVVAECRVEFLEGSKRVGLLDEKQSIRLFDIIEKSNKYSFNKCVSHNTILRRPLKSKSIYTVEEMYFIRNSIEYAQKTGHDDLRKKWKKIGYYDTGLSLQNDGRIRVNKILDIQPAGKQKLFRIITKCGATIDVTANHKFPIPNNKELTTEMLNIGDYLIICGELEKGYPTITSKIIDIEYIGEDETYDVTMQAPNHNYVVDSGIVTCNSHSVSYATISYQTAWQKSHYPLEFFTSQLRFAREKQDPHGEINKLVFDARLFNIEVCKPNIFKSGVNFELINNKIYYGLSDIKGIGISAAEKVKNISKEDNLDWNGFIVYHSNKLNSRVVENLIASGACDQFGPSRTNMLYQYRTLSKLTAKELQFLQANFNGNLIESLQKLNKPKSKGGGVANINRERIITSLINLLNNPPNKLVDQPDWIVRNENELLGVAFSYNISDLTEAEVNCTCREFLNGKLNDHFVIAGELREVKPWVIRRGQSAGREMVFLTIADDCLINAVAFPEIWETHSNIIYVGNRIVVSGSRDKKRGGLIIKRISEI